MQRKKNANPTASFTIRGLQEPGKSESHLDVKKGVLEALNYIFSIKIIKPPHGHLIQGELDLVRSPSQEDTLPPGEFPLPSLS